MEREMSKAMRIALITAGLDEQYQISLWEELEKAAGKKNIQLTAFSALALFQTTLQEKKTDFIKKIFREDSIDGIIFTTTSFNPYILTDEFNQLVEALPSIPIMSLGYELSRFPSVVNNNKRGMRELASHIIENHNPKKILFLSGPQGHQESEIRKTVFLETVNASGLDINISITTGSFLKESVEPALLQAQSFNGGLWDFDTLICANDIMAMEAMRVLSKWKIAVPEQTIVTGFDDIPDAAYFIPGLSTVKQPFAEMSSVAIKNIHKLIKGESVPQIVTLDSRFIPRVSCGCEGRPLLTENDPFSLSNKKDVSFDPHLESLFNTMIASKEARSGEIIDPFVSQLKKKIVEEGSIESWTTRLQDYLERDETSAIQRERINSVLNRLELFYRSQFNYIQEKDTRIFSKLRSTAMELLTAFESENIKRILNNGLSSVQSGQFKMYTINEAGKEVLFFEYPKNGMNTEKETSNIISPLFYNDEYLGYYTLEKTESTRQLYLSLTLQLANTIKMYNLFKERNQYTRRLEKEVAARTASLSEEVRQRKTAEKEALLKERKVRRILDAMPVPMVICREEDSFILYTNHPYRSMVQVNGELKEQYVSDLFKRRNDYDELLSHLKENRRVSGDELPLHLYNNKELWVSYAAQPLIYEDKKSYILGLTDRTQRKQLEDQILMISDRERTRFGQDLHDDICQRMAGISFLSAALEKNLIEKESSDAEFAAKISHHINDTISRTRKLASNLYPVSLQRMGILESLVELLEYYGEQYSKKIKHKCNIKDFPPFSEQQKLHLYRIVQEALGNAARHSDGTTLELFITRDENTFIIEVLDDGTGIKKKPEEQGMGMVIMQNRADFLGAEITIIQRESGGTCLQCAMKLKEVLNEKT